MASERKALLKDLLLLGCVEFSEPGELEGEGFPNLSRCSSGELSTDRANYAAILDAVRLMDKYAPAKGGGFLNPLPSARLDVVLDEKPLPADIAMAEKVMGKEEDIRRAASETARLEAAITAMAPWLELDVPLGFKGTEKLLLPRPACLPRRIWRRSTPRSEPPPRKRSCSGFPATRA